MAQHLRIVSKRAGFRRAGISHPDQPVFYRIEDLTQYQVAMLKAEPMLIVDEMDPPDAAPSKTAAKGKNADAAA